MSAHDHDHDHDHGAAALLQGDFIGEARRVTLVGVVVNLSLAVLKAVVGLGSGSSALVADAAHSVSDFVTDVIVLISTYLAAQPPDEDHPYGHGRFETIGTVLLATALVTAGAGIALAAIREFGSPKAGGSNLALLVAGISVLANEFLFRYTLAVGTRLGSRVIIANAWHNRSDAASSIAAFAGILGAHFGYPILDPVAAVIVGGMIIKIGLGIGWKGLQELTDTALEASLLEKITAEVRATPGVIGVHAVRARRMGPYVLVDLHLDVPGDWTVLRAHSLAEEVEQHILEGFLQVNELLIHLDPIELDDPDRESTQALGRGAFGSRSDRPPLVPAATSIEGQEAAAEGQDAGPGNPASPDS